MISRLQSQHIGRHVVTASALNETLECADILQRSGTLPLLARPQHGLAPDMCGWMAKG